MTNDNATVAAWRSFTDSAPNAKFLVPMDAGNDEQIAAVMQRAQQEFGSIDFLVHSIAYAPWTTSRARPPTAVGRVFGLQWKPVLIACSL